MMTSNTSKVLDLPETKNLSIFRSNHHFFFKQKNSYSNGYNMKGSNLSEIKNVNTINYDVTGMRLEHIFLDR